MKKFLLSSIVLLFLVGCGGGSSSSSNDQNDPNFDPYPNDQVDDNTTQNDTNTTEVISEITTLKPSNILAVFEKYGYTFSTLNLQTSFRASVDYQTYMYFTTQNNTVALLGDYVYALSNSLGQRLLVTIDAPSEFDILEKSSELILRANYTDNSASLRYTLPFTPKGYVNINTTRTNESASVGTLLSELANAFNQFILINPSLTNDSFTYSTDPTNASTFVVCNNQEFALDATQRSINFSNSFALEERVNCSTKSGVLIGSIYTPIEQPDDDNIIATIISGDLFKSIVRTTPQVEGTLTINKENLSFSAQKVTGKYGTFEILSSGSWIYILDTLNTSIQELTATQSLSEQFTITTSDNTQATVEVTIQGADNVIETIISGDLFKSILRTTPQVEGTLTINKENLGFSAQKVTGKYGTFEILSSGSWIYILDTLNTSIQELNATQSLSEQFTITTSDNTQATINVTIQGVNQIEELIDTIISGDLDKNFYTYQESTEGSVRTNKDDVAFIPISISGNYGDFSLTKDGQWSYILSEGSPAYGLDTGHSYEETFSIQTDDGVEATIMIRIDGYNYYQDPHYQDPYYQDPYNQDFYVSPPYDDSMFY